MPNKKFCRRGVSLVGTAAALSSVAGQSVLTNADLLKDRLNSSLIYRFANFFGWGWLKRVFENRIRREIIREYFSRCETKTEAEGPMLFKTTKYKEIAHEIFSGNMAKKAGFHLLKGENGQLGKIYDFLGGTDSFLGYSISNAGDWQNNYDDNTRLFNSIQNFNFMTKYLEHFKKLGLKFIQTSHGCMMFGLYDQGITVDFRGEKLGINNVNFNFSTDLGPNLNIIGRKTLADNSPQTIIDYSLKGGISEEKITIKEMQALLDSVIEKIQENQYPLNEKHKFANADLDINALKSLE